MNPIANSIKYPLTCPSCGANTAYALTKLLTEASVDCRHCNQNFTVAARQRSAIERTLRAICNQATATLSDQDATTNADYEFREDAPPKESTL